MQRSNRSEVYKWLRDLIVSAIVPLALSQLDIPTSLLIVIGVGCLFLLKAWESFPNVSAKHPRNRRMAFAGMIVSGIAFCGFTGWYFWHTDTGASDSSAKTVHELQVESFKAYPGFDLSPPIQSRLGKPLGDGETIQKNYQAKYERAGVVWLKRTLTFYILPINTTKWIEQPEPNTPKDQRYQDEEFLKSLFPDVPAGKKPPYAGIAKFWRGDPKKWMTRLGWREWDCAIKAVHYQEFENGFVFGPVLNTPWVPEGVIWVLYNNGSRETLMSAVPPECGRLH